MSGDQTWYDESWHVEYGVLVQTWRVRPVDIHYESYDRATVVYPAQLQLFMDLELMVAPLNSPFRLILVTAEGGEDVWYDNAEDFHDRVAILLGEVEP